MALKFNGDVFEITYHQHFAGDKKKVQATLVKYDKFRMGRLSYPNDYPDLWEAVTKLICSYQSACPACGRIASLSFDHRDEVFILSHECEQWKGFMKMVAPSQLVPFLKTLQHDRFACDSNDTAVGRNEYGLTMATYTNHYFGYDFTLNVRLHKHIFDISPRRNLTLLETIFGFNQSMLLAHPHYRKGALTCDVYFEPYNMAKGVMVCSYTFSSVNAQAERVTMMGKMHEVIFSPLVLLNQLWSNPIRQTITSMKDSLNTFDHLDDTPF